MKFALGESRKATFSQGWPIPTEAVICGELNKVHHENHEKMWCLPGRATSRMPGEFHWKWKEWYLHMSEPNVCQIKNKATTANANSISHHRVQRHRACYFCSFGKSLNFHHGWKFFLSHFPKLLDPVVKNDIVCCEVISVKTTQHTKLCNLTSCSIL